MSSTVERLSDEQARAHAGTWINGACGWRASARLVDIAHGYGMPATTDDVTILTAYVDGELDPITLSTGETLDSGEVADAVSGQGELADRAEAWLNDHIAPDGWVFAWIDGDFVLLLATELGTID
jgi:hypothetical protein